ncbi:NAD(P)H-binding protein [Kytococcus sedentarius]|uniref:NAD(P)H-binding protein n=1 Tax=Kytococcus sedentarius TaxID=1276 RepID=UPI003879FDC8
MTTSGTPTGTTPGQALVTGATGYIGSRLVPALLEAGWTVRVLARSPEKLEGRSWADDVDVHAGDANSLDDLASALEGVEVAYYLLHSMDGEGDFVERERAMAQTFAAACDAAGVGRIVYLGGMHPHNEPLSTHLYSRKAVGDVFLAADTPAAVLQAAVIVGAGSASFEMLRHLTDRLPVMLAPRWLDNRIQPIAVADVLHYLVGAASLPAGVNRAFDVGGDEVLRFRDMLVRYGQVAGLRRRRIALAPVMTPWLASHWVGLVTPVPAGVAKPLVGSLVHEVVVKDGRALEEFTGAPAGGHTPFDDAVARALVRADAVDPAAEGEEPADALPGDPEWVGRQQRTETWRSIVDAPADDLWAEVESIGSSGSLGPRGALGPWALESTDREGTTRSVRLRSTRALPGTARLTLAVTPAPHDAGQSLLTQEVTFVPHGLAGETSWWGSYPAHRALFTRVHQGIVERARVR